MIEVTQVSFAHGRQEVLKDVSLDLQPGRVLAVVGPNGAGKSTLLKLMSGEWVPRRGQVQLEGQPLYTYSVSALAKRRAVLPQFSELGFAFTVEEVVMMGRMPHQGDRESEVDWEICLKALAEVDLGTFAKRSYLSLSGGERQRVHLARVLAQIWEDKASSERYLLLDEPTASLDLGHKHLILKTVKRWAEQGVGVLMILHELNLAMQYADDVAILDEGHLSAYGSIRDTLTSSIIEHVFKVRGDILEHPDYERPIVVTRSI